MHNESFESYAAFGVCRLHDCAHLANPCPTPFRQTLGSSGYDLYACFEDSFMPEFFDLPHSEDPITSLSQGIPGVAWRNFIDEDKSPSGQDTIALPGITTHSFDEEFMKAQGKVSICRTRIPTGIALDIPRGYEMQIRPRSGLSGRGGIHVAFGTVDSDYYGEIMVNIYNLSSRTMHITNGMRIAQMIFSIIPSPRSYTITKEELEERKRCDPSDRGVQGHGHTGS